MNLSRLGRGLLGVAQTRVTLSMPMMELVERQVLGNAFDILNIAPADLNELSKLPFHHKDPSARCLPAAACLVQGVSFCIICRICLSTCKML